MKKTLKKTILMLLMIAFSTGLLVACVDKSEKFELAIPLDDTIPFLYGADISDAIFGNPDRGFRHELYITLDEGSWKSAKAYPSSSVTAEKHYLAEKDRLKEDAPNVAQLYVYLCNYNNKELSRSALEQLYSYLSYMRKEGVRVLIRFAYEHQDENATGPKTEVMLGHIAQLKQWFLDNKTVSNEAILAFQAGFIGLWGEWHGSQYDHDRKKVMAAIVDMVPDGKQLQVRTMAIKKNAQVGSFYKKIGFHDDFMVGEQSEWNIVDYTKGKNKSDYKNYKKQSIMTINDGEMPWGRQSSHIDAKLFIQSAYEHRLATLSLMHNFTEDGGSYNLKRFKTEYINEADLQALKVPYNPNWFTDGNGNKGPRTAFDYIQDHLGYQLVASNFKSNLKEETDSTGRAIKKGGLSFTLSNFGMGTPLSMDRIELYFRNPETGKIETKSTWLDGKWEAGKLKTYGQLTVSMPDVAFLKGWQVGIKIYSSTNKKNPIRLANNIQFIDGVNYIYTDK